VRAALCALFVLCTLCALCALCARINPTHPQPKSRHPSSQRNTPPPAGVPAVYGLYGAFLPVMVYAIFGSSRQLGVGPVAVTSLLIGSGESSCLGA